MERTLVVGDPIVHLGDEAFIPDGALIVEGKKVVEAGPRVRLEAMGPFDRIVGSPDHFVVPGFVASHFHSEVALGPGIYEMLFERANIFVHPLFKDMGSRGSVQRDPRDADAGDARRDHHHRRRLLRAAGP